MELTLTIDPDRWAKKEEWEGTGIYVRAKSPDDSWESADIALLDAKSLLVWLRSRGGKNPWAEDVVGILLGHGHVADQGS